LLRDICCRASCVNNCVDSFKSFKLPKFIVDDAQTDKLTKRNLPLFHVFVVSVLPVARKPFERNNATQNATREIENMGG